MNIAVVISTYNRVDDARINMEIIRNVWEKTNLFGKINIVHSYNGKKEWYLEKYLEDSLVVTENKGHFHGAANLLDAGFLEIERCKWDVDYLVFLAADTWITKPDFILSLLNEIKEEKLYLATNTWDALPDKPGNVLKAMASDFFVLDYKWALDLNIFPLDYGKFKEKYEDLFYYQGGQIMVEKILMAHVFRAIHDQTNNDPELPALVKNKIKVIEEREPVHEKIDENGLWVRKMYWPKIGLITNHKSEEKKKILKDLGLNVGPNCKKLINSENLDYFNHGFSSFQSVN